MTIFTTLLWTTAISFFASRIENCCCRKGTRTESCTNSSRLRGHNLFHPHSLAAADS